MSDSWKYSKGNYITILITTGLGLFVFDLAYHNHRYSEILSGVIGGITIILGMLTSEWLRSTRERVREARELIYKFLSNLEPFLYNLEDFSRSPLAHGQTTEWNLFVQVRGPLVFLAGDTRWPQPRASKIRALSSDLDARIIAMYRDAFENGYIWNVQERLELNSKCWELHHEVWGRKNHEIQEIVNLTNSYRKSPLNDISPRGWERDPSK
jgi:hypothetical protein